MKWYQHSIMIIDYTKIIHYISRNLANERRFIGSLHDKYHFSSLSNILNRDLIIYNWYKCIDLCRVYYMHVNIMLLESYIGNQCILGTSIKTKIYSTVKWCAICLSLEDILAAHNNHMCADDIIKIVCLPKLT